MSRGKTPLLDGWHGVVQYLNQLNYWQAELFINGLPVATRIAHLTVLWKYWDNIIFSHRYCLEVQFRLIYPRSFIKSMATKVSNS